ncbi:MAG: sulfate ABC transporter permease subunit CysT [Gemmataceae bacterium]|nr:sulfate ABC transporter permease subunit CysT [Gemmataceae bacterium]
MTSANRHVLPGLRLSLSVTGLYLLLLVIIPLAACVIRAVQLSPAEFVAAALTRRALAAVALTFGASFVAAFVDVALGLLVAWVLVRYDFPMRKFADALVDLPFALPTAVAGLVYASLYSDGGWIGQWLTPLGFHVAYTRLGIVVVLVFLGLPFVVRTVQPVLEGFDAEVEEAAASLGATRWQTFRAVLLPQLTPALLTGFALALARALGEYGSVIFISGNMPFRTEIASKLIVEQLEQFNEGGATAIAVVLLGASFIMLGVVNWLERRRAYYGA